MSTLTDAQQQAIETLDVNVAVAAGAGAGKTRVLVERYLTILRRRQFSCEEIIAITFTRKAAKEMKERIRFGIEQELAVAESDNWTYWNDCKSRLEYAPISTFHSLCARILRENPVEAALDPGFAVLEENEARLLFRDVLENVVLLAAKQEKPWLEELLRSYKLRDLYQSFPVVYEELQAAGWLDGRLDEHLTAPYRQAATDLAKLKREIVETGRELIGYAAELKPKAVARQKLEQVKAAWPEIEQALYDQKNHSLDDIWQEKVMAALKGIRLNGAAKEVKQHLEELYSDWAAQRACETALPILAALAAYYQELYAAWEKKKKEKQSFTFADLENRTLALLKENPEICRKYSQKYRYLMVDEFQDTNDRQRQFVYLLAGGDSERLRGDKLFIVGDPKQSIYRFRGADVAVFERVRQDIVKTGGATIDLDTNFRSQQGLISFTNQLFDEIFSEDELIRFEPIKGNKNCSKREAFAEWLVLTENENGTADRSGEAAMLADRLQKIIGEKIVYDEKNDELRPAEYRDMAILFRAFTDISRYEAALRAAGIPYYIVGGRGFYARQEVLDVIHFLEIIDNCYDDLAWIGVLRSPFFMLDDRTLVAVTADQSSVWEGLQQAVKREDLSLDQRQICQQAVELLQELRRVKEFLPLSELIEAVLAKTLYREFLLSRFMGQQKVANVEKLCTLAQQQEANGASLDEFLAYLHDVLAEQVEEGEAQIESESGNTVKLLTIHKSKGLEYPIVFLPDLERQLATPTEKILFSAEFGLGLSTAQTAAGENSVYRSLKDRNNQLERSESKRLFYVAATRAKDYLLFSSIATAKTGERSRTKSYQELANWHQWLLTCFQVESLDPEEKFLACGHEKLQFTCYRDLPESPLVASEGAALSPQATLDLGFIQENLRAINEQKSGREPLFSATMLGRFQFCPRSYYYRYLAGIPECNDDSPANPTENKKTTAAQSPAAFEAVPAQWLGQVVHKFIEIYSPDAAVDTTLKRAAAFILPEEWRAAAVTAALPFCQNYLASEFAGDATPRHEWPFVFPLAGEAETYYFRGWIDQLTETADQVELVDFKTDHLTGDAAAFQLDHYQFQLQLYALAATLILRKPVRRASLCFLRTGEVLSVPLTKAESFSEQLIAIGGFLQEHSQEADYAVKPQHCRFCSYRFFCRSALKIV